VAGVDQNRSPAISRAPTDRFGLCRAQVGKPELSEEDLASLGDLVSKLPATDDCRPHGAVHSYQRARDDGARVDVTHIVELRNRIKEDFARKFGAKLTYTAVCSLFTSRVLKDFPKDQCVDLPARNIISARHQTSVGPWLFRMRVSWSPWFSTPTRKAFRKLRRTSAGLIILARSKSLTRTDVESGTFTISNFGSLAV